jgi:hypothetical protein
MIDCEWMLEIVNRAVLDWRLLIQAKAWKCKKFYPVRGGNEKLPSYNCNFAELRQFFKSEWCQLCLQMNRSSLSAVMILNKLEAELAEAMEKDEARERRKHGQRTM